MIYLTKGVFKLKRILHYGLSDNLGGIESFIKTLYSGIDKDEYVFDFIINKNITPYFLEDYKKAGSKFYYISSRKMTPYQNILDIKKIFQKKNIDAFHFHGNTLSYKTPIIQSINKGIPTIVHSHSSNTGTSLITSYLHARNKKRISSKNIAKIAVSDKAGEWFFDKENYRIINNGIDLATHRYSQEKREKFRRDNGALEDDYLIVHIGSFTPVKNHLFLLKVFLKFNRIRPNSKLILVGKGQLEKEIKEHAENMGLAENVLFLGLRTDISDIFSGADLFLFPSLYEGFPLVALEAQTSGIDMIMSDTITSEVIVNDNNNVLPINNTEELWVDSMLNFYEKSSDIELREKAYRNVEDANLTNRDTIKAIENLYKEILEK